MIHLVCPNPALDRTLIFDSIHVDSPNRPMEVRETPGGKSFNVAYALAHAAQLESGVPEIKVHAPLGGFTGLRVTELAASGGLDVTVVPVDAITRICTIAVDKGAGHTYPLYENGLEFDSASQNALQDSIVSHVSAGDWVVFSGSLPAGMGTDFIDAVVGACKSKGVFTAIDTNGDALVAAHEATPTMLKINDEELAQLTGSAAGRFDDPDEVAKALLHEVSADIPIVIITLGGRGAIARAGGELTQYTGESLHAVNPVASGDIFLGGLLSVVANESAPKLGDALEDASGMLPKAVRRAMSWAASNCMHDFPHIDDAEAQGFEASITQRSM